MVRTDIRSALTYPPTYLKIWRHMWMLPSVNSVVWITKIFKTNLVCTIASFHWSHHISWAVARLKDLRGASKSKENPSKRFQLPSSDSPLGRNGFSSKCCRVLTSFFFFFRGFLHQSWLLTWCTKGSEKIVKWHRH